IDADTAAGIDNMIENLKNRVQASLEQGETLSDEELASRAEEEYNKILADCGLTEEDLRNWQKSIYIQQKLTDHVNEGFTYEYEKAEQEVKDIIADAQAAYKADNSDYDPDSLKSLYIPEGSRYVRHVLVKLDDETISQIRSLRSENKDEEADKLREERVAEMSDKISEIESLAASGTDFSELMNKYSDDTDTTMSYLVVPGTKKYMAEFTECALGIEKVGATGTTLTDYGWHIIEYTSDAVVTEQDRKEYTDALYRYLEDAYKTQNLNERMAEWRAEFKYTIDRETLMLAEETAK
ncbi:MAG: peptidylprolyl isomerase, partial [Oscillospiraceae bacterium]